VADEDGGGEVKAVKARPSLRGVLRRVEKVT